VRARSGRGAGEERARSGRGAGEERARSGRGRTLEHETTIVASMKRGTSSCSAERWKALASSADDSK
jgi:hypothetical protein